MTFDFHAGQQAVMDSDARFPFAIAGVQGGKTTIGCPWIIRETQKGEPGLSYIVAPDYPMLKLSVMKKFFTFYPELRKNFNKTEKLVTLPDGNEIAFKSADAPDTLRAATLKAWWIDEISMCGKDAFEIMQGRVIATGGRGLCTGTPKGKNFLESIKRKALEPDSMFSFNTWPTFNNPGADREYLTKLASEWSDDYRRQELEAELIDWEESVFKQKHLDSLFGQPIELSEPIAGRFYGTGWDLARKVDWTVCFVIDEITGNIVHYERFQHKPWPYVIMRINEIARKYPGKSMLDSSGVGDPVLQGTNAEGVEGFIFTQKSKFDLIMNLLVSIEECKLHSPNIPRLKEELRNYLWDDKKLVQDTVMALALANLAITNINPTGGIFV